MTADGPSVTTWTSVAADSPSVKQPHAGHEDKTWSPGPAFGEVWLKDSYVTGSLLLFYPPSRPRGAINSACRSGSLSWGLLSSSTAPLPPVTLSPSHLSPSCSCLQAHPAPPSNSAEKLRCTLGSWLRLRACPPLPVEAPNAKAWSCRRCCVCRLFCLHVFNTGSRSFQRQRRQSIIP